MSRRELTRFCLTAMAAGVSLLLVAGLAGVLPPGSAEASPMPETPLLANAESTPRTPAYQAGTWVYTGGPIGGLGYDIRMDPRNPDVMCITDAWAGALKSVDGGAHWYPINDGITTRVGPSLDGIPAFCVTIDPNNPDTLWVGAQDATDVFRSDDGGAHWTSMNNGIAETLLTTRGSSVEPGNSNVVYLAGEVAGREWNGEHLPGILFDKTEGVVCKTVDRGQDWARLWYDDNLTRYVWIHPTYHNLLYVSTGIFDREAANSDAGTVEPGGVGILRSRDGGETWQVLAEANGLDEDELYFVNLYMHPTNRDVLLAAASNDGYAVHIIALSVLPNKV